MIITSKRTFNRAAPQYDAYCTLQQHIGQQLISLLQPHLTTKARMIDIGCGTGQVTAKLASLGIHTALHAMDNSKEMVAVAKTRLSPLNITVACENFDNLPTYPASFDVIFANMSLQWSRHFEQTLAGLTTQLNPHGLIAFSVPLPDTLSELKPHFAVNTFVDWSTIQTILINQGYRLLRHQTEKHVLTFNDTTSALRSVKNIGSYAMNTASLKGLSGKNKLRKLAITQLTYCIGYVVATK
jgi:malonyl-CoA O-methyltransferase